MPQNPLHGTEAANVLLLVVMRFSDKAIVAYFQKSKDVTIEGVRECVAGSANIQNGKRYTSQGSTQSIHYTLDNQG